MTNYIKPENLGEPYTPESWKALQAENTRLREALWAFLSDPNVEKCTYVNLDFVRAALAPATTTQETKS